jgi:MOSC domain-containing protein YiiM
MDDPGFVKKFARANRGGAYARVLRPGPVSAGLEGRLSPGPPEAPSIDDLFALWHSSLRSPELMQRALHYPLAERYRANLEAWLLKA